MNWPGRMSAFIDYCLCMFNHWLRPWFGGRIDHYTMVEARNPNQAYSGLMFASFITFAHLMISSSIKVCTASGVLPPSS